MLTEKQQKVLSAISEYIEKEKIAPTVREIGEITGLKSTSSVHSYLKKLEEKGYLTSRKDSPRSIRVIKTC